MEAVFEEIIEGILDGEMEVVAEKVQEALDAGIEPRTILNDGLIKAMGEVGQLFEDGEFFVPEMLVSSRAMKAGLAIIKPLLADAEVQAVGKVAAGTVAGDLHDIGKNLVCTMLEGAGFEIKDLGSDVAPEQFVEAVKRDKVDIIVMSALLTTTMPNMAVTIEALKTAGLRDSVKVMVGGAPVTESFAQKIGADGYSEDASKAVTVAKRLVNA